MLVYKFGSGFFEVGGTDKAHIAMRTKEEQTFGPILEGQPSMNRDGRTMTRLEQADACKWKTRVRVMFIGTVVPI